MPRVPAVIGSLVIVIPVVLSAALAPGVSAAPACSGGPPSANTSITCAPNGSGYRDFTVPTGVDAIIVVADGGGGGKNASLSNGGSGARVSATIPVTLGQVVRVYVGAGGGAGLGGAGNAGGNGYGVGGNGGPYYGEGFGGGYGGGGGGSSAVLVDGTPRIIAGGGGGGGESYGGSATQDGAAGGGDGTCARGGGGGHGGVAGSASGTGVVTSASGGFNGRGGSGSYGAGGASSGGGGGGGGYGGGGAGNWNGPYGCNNAGGGGGGGSYATVSATNVTFGSANNRGLISSGTGDGQDGSVTITFHAAVTVPQAPTLLEFADVRSTQISMFWTPPANDGGSPLIGYDVEVDSSGTLTRVNSPLFTATSLTANTLHTFRITAVNAQGSSLPLAGSELTPASDPGIADPNPPTSMTFSDVTTTSIRVSWLPPVGGAEVAGYKIQIDGGTRDTCGPYSPCTGSPYTLTGLDPNSSHTVRVFAVNGAGGSSLPLSGTQSTLALVPPGDPTNLTFSNVTDSSITASWDPPAGNGGPAVTGYQVSVDDAPPVTVTGTSFQATGLLAESWHRFSIVAVNVDGESFALVGSRSTRAQTSELPPAETPVTPPSEPATPGVTEKTTAQVSGLTLPRRITSPGRTVLLKRALTTNDGTAVSARVTFRPKKANGARVRYLSSGKVVVIFQRRTSINVTLTLRAPASATSQPYLQTKTWRVKAKR